MTRYRIDPARSRVKIDATSSVHPIHSETDGLEGWVEVTLTATGRLRKGAPSGAHLELAVALLRGGNPLEARELQKRLDARTHPTIIGDLRSLSATDQVGRFTAQGDITLRGVTRPHEDALTIEPDGPDAIRIRGSSTFDIRDFGMEPPRILMLKVNPDVTVTVDITATTAS